MATAQYTSAVIRTGGKQYVAKPGEVLKIEKLPQEVGEAVTFSDVVLAFTSEGAVDATPSTNVSAEVIEVGRGKKVRVATYQSKKRHRRVIGHRQDYTKVRITSIGK